MSLRALFVTSFLALVAAGFPSVSRATPPSRDRVLELLNSYEGNSNRAAWTALGAETPDVLFSVYNDSHLMPYVRIRAVAAVANFPSEATHAFLRRVASQPGQGELFVREAVLALANAFGVSAESEIAPYLEHASAVVRIGAVHALSGFRSATASNLLRARLPLERSADVREAISHALAH